MKPMDLMDAVGDVPADLVEQALDEKPIREKTRTQIILSRIVAVTALAASVAIVAGLIHMIGRFSEQPETSSAKISRTQSRRFKQTASLLRRRETSAADSFISA